MFYTVAAKSESRSCMSEYGMRRFDSCRGFVALSRRVIPLHGIVPQKLGPRHMAPTARRIAKSDQMLKAGFQRPHLPANLCNHWLFLSGNGAKYTHTPGHPVALTAHTALAFSARGEAAQHRARP
jgi:hypothetical protein